MPAPITCAIAVFYGKLKRIPVVLDARDMWPDVFVLEKGAVSFKLRLLAALMRIELRYACKGATAHRKEEDIDAKSTGGSALMVAALVLQEDLLNLQLVL